MTTLNQEAREELKNRDAGCCGGDGCPYYQSYGLGNVENHDDCISEIIDKYISLARTEALKEAAEVASDWFSKAPKFRTKKDLILTIEKLK